jgi:hypothetical protein
LPFVWPRAGETLFTNRPVRALHKQPSPRQSTEEEGTPMKMLTCAACGRTKRVPDHYLECCSKKCVHVLMKRRNPDHYFGVRLNAAAAAGQHSADRTVAHWAKLYPGVPVETVRAIRRAGFHAGYISGQRKGFEQGKAATEAQMRIAGVRTIVVRDGDMVAQ